MKRHTMDFESFSLNESPSYWFTADRIASWLDYDLAFITINVLADAKVPFDREVYLSPSERDEIAKKYGKRLPPGFVEQTRHITPGSIIGPLVDDVVYTDETDLIKGAQVIFEWPDTTWDDVRTMLQTRFGILTKEMTSAFERKMKAGRLFGV